MTVVPASAEEGALALWAILPESLRTGFLSSISRLLVIGVSVCDTLIQTEVASSGSELPVAVTFGHCGIPEVQGLSAKTTPRPSSERGGNVRACIG